MFNKILIAARGEIACRIARTCRRLGVGVTAVHTAADRNALHVSEIGESILLEGEGPADGYLNIAALLAAAHECGAQAIHPGIGFLAEDPSFAEAVEGAGLAFIGPRPDTMIRFGDKLSAKREAMTAGLPVLAGHEEGFSDPARLEEVIRGLGHPVLLKAMYGGGGRGVRVIRDPKGASGDIAGDIASAMREAMNAFGRPDLMVERFLEDASHVEVQIAGDGEGDVVHLFERECSLQRRFQKIVEESPAALLPQELRERLWADATRLGAQARIRNLATIEFLVSGYDHFFLECNPRLQVEHTVTELVTGRDLVELQLRIAAEGNLNLRQEDISLSGHAIQARVYAEDPAAGFAPSTGPVLLADFPSDRVRVDAGIETGSEIGPHYDALLAKLISWDTGRQEALRRLTLAVTDTTVLGVATNLPLLETLLVHPAVVAGKMDIRFIEREGHAWARGREMGREALATAACLLARARRSFAGGDPWTRLEGFTGWRLRDGRDEPPHPPAFLLRAADELHRVSVGAIAAGGVMELRLDGEPIAVQLIELEQDRVRVSVGKATLSVRAILRENTIHLRGPFGSWVVTAEPFLTGDEARGAASGHLLSPMMGRIIKLNVRIGDAVKAEDILAVQESMKMEFSVRAPWDGIVTDLACKVDDMVERHSHMITVEPLELSGEA